MKSILLLVISTCISMHVSAQAWKIAGNENIDATINFIGTSNATDVVIKTNNIERGRWMSGGDWRWGDAANFATFDFDGDLILTGTADYLLNGNRYVCRDFSDGDVGLYYDAFKSRFELRNEAAVMKSYFTAQGHGYFSEQLAIGSESFNYKFNVENATSTRSGYFNNTYNIGNTKYGIYNLVGDEGTGGRYGIYSATTSNAASTAANYGMFSLATNAGTGRAYGYYASVASAGTGTHYGYYAALSTAGTNAHYGLYAAISGAGTGNRYGVYSSAAGSANYSFYGLGRGYFSESVGIGITNPSAELHINGTDEVLRIDGTSPYINLRDGGENLGFLWANVEDVILGTNVANDDGKLILRTNGEGRMYINSAGNTGIGIADPLSPLHIDGSDDVLRISGISDPYIQFSQDGIDVGFIQANTDNLRLGTNADNLFGNIIFSSNGIARMLIDHNGNIGIGVSDETQLATGYLLSVDGKIICEELRVEIESNWPDYVFAEDYKLMTLMELKEFISVNKRLPGIPSASVVEESGIEVGEMQTMLMAKVEELTLYVLQLESRLAQLESK